MVRKKRRLDARKGREVGSDLTSPPQNKRRDGQHDHPVLVTGAPTDWARLKDGITLRQYKAASPAKVCRCNRIDDNPAGPGLPLVTTSVLHQCHVFFTFRTVSVDRPAQAGVRHRGPQGPHFGLRPRSAVHCQTTSVYRGSAQTGTI